MDRLAAVWLATVQVRPLLDPDEGRYAEIPRELLASGDWITPRLNELKYFEKPPLQLAWSQPRLGGRRVHAAVTDALAFTDPSQWTSYQQRGLAGRVIANDGETVAVSRR